jgi:hypothetical protein
MNSRTETLSGFRLRQPMRAVASRATLGALAAIACATGRGPLPGLLSASAGARLSEALAAAALALLGISVLMLLLGPLHRIVIAEQVLVYCDPWHLRPPLTVRRDTIAKVTYRQGKGLRLTDPSAQQIGIIPDRGWTRQQRETLTAALGCASAGIWTHAAR